MHLPRTSQGPGAGDTGEGGEGAPGTSLPRGTGVTRQHAPRADSAAAARPWPPRRECAARGSAAQPSGSRDAPGRPSPLGATVFGGGSGTRPGLRVLPPTHPQPRPPAQGPVRPGGPRRGLRYLSRQDAATSAALGSTAPPRQRHPLPPPSWALPQLTAPPGGHAGRRPPIGRAGAECK